MSATTAPLIDARTVYASDVREGDLLTLPQPPLVRVMSIEQSKTEHGVQLLVFQAEVADAYTAWTRTHGDPLASSSVTFVRWPFEAMQVFRRWEA